MKTIKLLASACFSLIISSSLFAAPITNLADPILSGADVINFDELANGYLTSGGIAHKEDIVNFNHDHPYQSNYYVREAGPGYYSVSGKYIGIYNKANFTFDQTISSFAFILEAINAAWTIEAIDSSGNIIEVFEITDGCCGFIDNGFASRGVAGISASGIAEINMFFHSTPSDWYDSILLDNFTYVKEHGSSIRVSEPNILVLLLIGIISISTRKFWGNLPRS